jgi:hypothetical protein
MQKLFKPIPSYDNFDPISFDSKANTAVQSSLNFLETLKSLTNNLKDTYKQVSLKTFTMKTEKAPPPADLFANLPTATNFQIGTPLFTNLGASLNFSQINS